jgi:hypothetical protein
MLIFLDLRISGFSTLNVWNRLKLFGSPLSMSATVHMSLVLNSNFSAELSNFGPGTFLTYQDLLQIVI